MTTEYTKARAARAFSFLDMSASHLEGTHGDAFSVTEYAVRQILMPITKRFHGRNARGLPAWLVARCHPQVDTRFVESIARGPNISRNKHQSGVRALGQHRQTRGALSYYDQRCSWRLIGCWREISQHAENTSSIWLRS